MVKSVNAVNAVLVSTSNMDEMIQFYQKLGILFRIEDHGSGKHAEADVGGVHFSLRTQSFDTQPGTRVSVCFHVPNLEECCKNLESCGLRLVEPPKPMPFGGVIAVIADPDGNQVFLSRWQTDEEYNRNFPANRAQSPDAPKGRIRRGSLLRVQFP
jgi:predicted enzyme related to lactoylglutathione lyase